MKKRFVATKVEIEGRQETKLVELPHFDVEPWAADHPLQLVGSRLERVDAVEKVSGTARYTTDIQLPGMLHAVIVRAPIPAGTAVSIDLSRALAVPGVRDAIAAPETAGAINLRGAGLFNPRVRYAGQPVAAVCAESEAIARHAARAVRVEYAVAPFAASVAQALAPDAPLVRTQGNIAEGEPDVTERGDAERGLADAELIAGITLRTPVALHTALEPHGAVAAWDGRDLTVWESTQGIFHVRDDLAEAFDLPLSSVRVVMHYMGGGFGAKNSARAHTYTAALFARRLGAPVRCVNDREAEQTDAGNRPATIQRVRLGAKRDGTLTAIALEADVPLGISGWEGGPAGIYHELYACPNVRTSVRLVYVNTSAMSSFRAPGHAEGAFGLERAMDALARQLAMDPVELRLRNFADRDQRRGRTYSLNRLRECYEDASRRFGWDVREERRGTGRASVRRGFGMAAQIWGTGGGPPAYAVARINSDGTAEIATGTQDLGTGAQTVFAQIAAEALGFRVEDVRLVIGDTAAGPYTGNSWGSTTTASVGPAVRMAAEEARTGLLEAAAHLLDVRSEELELHDSVATHRKSGRSLSAAAICGQLGDVMIIGRGSRGPNPENTAMVTFGAQFAEVEVNIETGVVAVVRVVATHDAGRVVNPTLAESQLEGGIIQGLGYALFEERVLDERLGLPLNPTMHEYKIPTMLDAPVIEGRFLDGADPVANHIGAKGLAEPAIIPTAPAIANAVSDAIGREMTEIPLTPWRVLTGSHSGGAR